MATDRSVANHYEFLGVANFASRHEIAAAIERAGREATAVERIDPQRAHHIRDRLRIVRQDILGDERRKHAYDAWLVGQDGLQIASGPAAASALAAANIGPFPAAGQTEQLWPVRQDEMPVLIHTTRTRKGKFTAIACIAGVLTVTCVIGIIILASPLSGSSPPVQPTATVVPTVPPDLKTPAIMQSAIAAFQNDRVEAFGRNHNVSDLPNTMSGVALKGVHAQAAYLVSRHEYEILGWSNVTWQVPVFAPDGTAAISAHEKLENDTYVGGVAFPTHYWIWARYRLTYSNQHWFVSFYWLSEGKPFWKVRCSQRSDATSDALREQDTC